MATSSPSTHGSEFALPPAPAAAPARRTRPRRVRMRALGRFTFFCLLAAVFLSHFLVYFFKLTSGFLPTSLTALLPTMMTLGLYALTALDLFDRGLRVPFRLLDLVVVAFVMLSLAQIFNDHVTIVFGLRSFQRTAFFCGMYFVGRFLVDTPRRTSWVLEVMALTIGLAGGFAILSSVLGLQLEGSYAAVVEARGQTEAVDLAVMRSYGTLASQAAFGVMSGLGVLVALAATLAPLTWRRQLISLGAMGMCAIGLLLSGTRSALLGVAIGILPLLWLATGEEVLRLVGRQRVRKSVLAGLLGMLAVALVVLVLAQRNDSQTATNTAARLRTISPATWLSGDALREANLSTRVGAWRDITGAILERPLQGYGTGVLGGGSTDARVGVQLVAGQAVADNIYLELWGELGLVGLLLFLIALAALAGSWLRWRSPPVILVVSSLMIGVAAFFAINGIGNAPIDYYPANAFFWLLLGISANLPQLHRHALAALQTGKP